MLSIYNHTVNYILNKMGREPSTHDIHFIENGWLYGQSFSNHIRGYYGTPVPIIQVTTEEAELFHKLSEADKKAHEDHDKARLAELDAEAASWDSFSTEVPGYTINKYHEVVDQYGNYLFTLPRHARNLTGPQLENLILSTIEDLFE